MSAGQHALELTSVSDGVESERSQQLLVLVAGAATTSRLSSVEQSPPSQPITSLCSREPQATCYSIHVVASDLGRVTALSPMPDGRAMFIEDGRQVRVIARGTLSPSAALAAEPGRRLTGLTTDSGFEESRLVFVAWTELARGVPALNITRYREVENTLGEAAMISTALPAGPDLTTPLAVDNEDLVYVAVPADRSGSGQRFLGNAGAVMRFDRDGLVPRSNQYGSPIVAEGYGAPLALAIDRPQRTLWIAGRDRERLGAIATLGLPTRRGSAWPSRPVAAAIQSAENEEIESITIIGQRETGDARRLVLATGGRLLDIMLTPQDAVRSVSDIPLGDGYSAHAVAADQDGSLYVGAQAPDGSGSVLILVRLTR